MVDVGSRRISVTTAKKVLLIMAETGRSAREIVEERDWWMCEDVAKHEAAVDDVLAKFPKQVEEYRALGRK